VLNPLFTVEKAKKWLKIFISAKKAVYLHTKKETKKYSTIISIASHYDES